MATRTERLQASVAGSAISRPTLLDRLRDGALARRDRWLRAAVERPWMARIPVVGAVARWQSRALFDLCAGFTYTQVLAACVRSGLLAFVAESPRTIAAIAGFCELPPDGAERLVKAASALGLLGKRSMGRVGLGANGVSVLATPGLARLIDHNVLLYDDLRDPFAVLRQAGAPPNAVRQYYQYGTASSPDAIPTAGVTEYSALMAETAGPVAAEVLDAVPFAERRSLLDVGGGTGAFLRAVAARHPRLALSLFDLPAVAELARARFAEAGVAATVSSGDFHRDPLPAGADVVTFVRVLLDHDDAAVLSLLERARAALVSGGMVVIAEPMGDAAAGMRRITDAYFGLYLRAMGRGRARSASEYSSLLTRAGFRGVRRRRTRYPVLAGVVTGVV